MGTAAELSRIQPASHEQRLSVRKRLSGPIPIQLFPDQEVLLSEVSEGGLSVTASSRLDVGAVAQVSFQLPETDSDIDATVAVAWSDISGRAGIRFTSLPQASLALQLGALLLRPSACPAQGAAPALATRIGEAVRRAS